MCIRDRGGGVPHSDKQIWSFGKSKELAKQSLDNFHHLPGLQTLSLYDSSNGAHLKSDRYRQTSLDRMSENNLTKGKFKVGQPLMELLKRSPRYKLGIGLALCKVYAEYWNGDLTVHSIQGYGTDTVLKLGNLMRHTDKLQLDRV